MTDYLVRRADALLAEMIVDHSAVLVVGPRAAGKTTTCERAARSAVRLADPVVSAAFRSGGRAILDSLESPVLIDEWQEAPESLNLVKLIVDASPARGQFIVTGSVRGDIGSPTWPGTGRLVRLEMFGLTEREIAGALDGRSWMDRLLHGEALPSHRTDLDVRDYVGRALRSGFPEPVMMTSDRARMRWLQSYVDHVVTRDAAAIAPRRDPERLRSYLIALALNSAGVVDDVTLWQAAGIAKDTARAYDALLEQLFLTDRLPAWTSNRLKRLTLAPKRYLVDPGLFAGVLGVTESEALLDGGLLGRLLETFVIAQIRAETAAAVPTPRLHHLRMAEGRHEVDLVIEVGARRLIAIEVKATSTPDPGDVSHLRWLRRELGESHDVTTVLLHTGTHTVTFDDGTVATPIASLWEA